MKVHRKHNLRDLGGVNVSDTLVVRTGVLLRSGNLYALSAKDAQKLAEGHVSLVIDLRTPIEVKEKPDVQIPGAEYMLTPLLTNSEAGITHQNGSDPVKVVQRLKHDKDDLLKMIPDMEAIYLKMITEPSIQGQLSKALSALIDAVLQGRTVLFHCTEGKDRTGILSAIILSVLGVSRTNVLSDYVKTNRSAYFKALKKGCIVGALTHSMNMGLKAYQLYMAQNRHLIKTMSVIRKRYSTVDQFVIEALHIDKEKLDQFKQYMLVPASQK